MRTLLWFLALIPTPAAAQEPLRTYADAVLQRTTRMAPKLDYAVAVPDDRSAYLVELTISRPPDPAVLRIPAWAPGAYRLLDSGHGITALTATGADGGALPVTQDDDRTWRVATGGADRMVVRYRAANPDAAAFARPNNRWYLRRTSGLIDGPQTFLYLDGALLAPSHVTFRLPVGWRIATGLVATPDPEIFWAPSYDVLIDSPVLLGEFASYGFVAAGVPHRVVVDANGAPPPFDTTAFVDMVRRAVHAGLAVFGTAPYKDFTFIYAGTGGGLEHLNSTTIGIDLSRTAANARDRAGVTAHEFFHTWNVKRIRPVELGPFDYTRPVRTLNLWWSEGVTDYYADLLRVRSGLDDTAGFVANLGRSLANHRANPARLVVSPERASWTTWDGPGARRISYYLQGEVLGFALDLTIRDSTDNRASLDDVMRALFDRYAGARGFTSEDLLNTANAVCGCDLQEFWGRYVSGTAEVPWNNFLRSAGWRVDFTHVPRAGADTARLVARVRDLPTLTDRMHRIRDGIQLGH